jgi:hypothetical protein
MPTRLVDIYRFEEANILQGKAADFRDISYFAVRHAKCETKLGTHQCSTANAPPYAQYVPNFMPNLE